MSWRVELHPDFLPEYQELPLAVQNKIVALSDALKTVGPNLKRPQSDTLSGSKHANMKELRFDADDGAWRVAYAFDPVRDAMLLVAGDKSGVSQKRFYRALLAKADTRFDEHLKRLARKGH